MGLRYPDDLSAWRRWQARRRRLPELVSRLKGRQVSAVPAVAVAVRGARPRVLVALDSRSVTTVQSVQSVLDSGLDVAVASSVHTPDELRGLLGSGAGTATVQDLTGSGGGDLRVIVSAGHYLPAGSLADELADSSGARKLVIQHGLVTPFAPPLPRGAHLLSFSQDDAGFWASGRPDVTSEVVGSALLWDAARNRRPEGGFDKAPVYLGQLHGTELSRWGKTRATTSFWRQTGSVYRPHPAERDRLSVLQHRIWRRLGMEFELSGEPLADLGRPVVAAFSTGVIEAAAQGVPSWVHYPDPPPWLRDFWERYTLSVWGVDQAPTPAPPVPDLDPRLAISRVISREIGEHA